MALTKKSFPTILITHALQKQTLYFISDPNSVPIIEPIGISLEKEYYLIFYKTCEISNTHPSFLVTLKDI